MNPQNLKVVKMEIKVLGTGCAKCKSLEKNTRQAVEELQLDAVVTKIEDITEIMQHGVMTTPALIKNDVVILKGRVPNVSELKEILTQ